MPTGQIVSINIGDLPWPFRKPELQAISEDETELAWMDAKFEGKDLVRVPLMTEKGKDHIYIRGLNALEWGEDTDLSKLTDHPAVWVRVEWS